MHSNHNKLFLKKVIDKHIKEAPIPSTHLDILERWQSKLIKGESETNLDGKFIEDILVKILGYESILDNGTGTVSKNEPVGRGNVDIALGFFTETERKIMAPFELKGAKQKDLDKMMAGRHKSPVQQAWEYASDARGSKWVLVSNYLEIRLYLVSYDRYTYEKFELAKLTEPREYAKFQLLLSAKNLLGDKTLSLIEENEKANKEITNRLYGLYKELRHNLIGDIQANNPHVEKIDTISYAQTILDRILFIAFAEDKELLPKEILNKAYTQTNAFNPQPIYENFQGLFKAINEGSKTLGISKYNGGLFRKDEKTKELDGLTVSDAICEQFHELSKYDFKSEISVNVLGHIFEQSISDIENLQKEARGETSDKVGKVKKEGVVYTPDYITAFIVEKTVGTYLKENFARLLKGHGSFNDEGEIEWNKNAKPIKFWRAYQEFLRTVKIVDPACGSGAFLVAVFDFLHEEFIRVNGKLEEITGTLGDLVDLDKDILSNNLYGVDINRESIEITKLSLWLKTARKGKVLDSLDDNLKVGDSLIEDSNYSYRAFTWKGSFKSDEFDVVVGNPPYVRQEYISHLKPYLQGKYEVYNGTADLYSYFFERGMRLLKKGGRMGYISSSTFFKTGSGQNLREFLLRYNIENIVDFGDLQVFEGVTTYPAIVTVANEKATDSDIRFLKVENKVEDLIELFDDTHATMSQRLLGEDSWRLEDENIAKLRTKITKGKKTLKEVYGSPLYGIKTGYNDAFVIDRATRDRLIQQDPKSEALIKPFLEGKDLKKWHTAPRDLYLILIPKGWTREQTSLTDEQEAFEWLEKHYPSIAEYIKPHEQKAKKRTDKGDFWWELRACSYYKQFEKPKIFYPLMSQGAKFAVNNSGLISNQNSYIVPSNDWFLLGLLNSNIVWFFLHEVCDALRGGVWRLVLKAIFIETIPIPKATKAQKEEIGSLAMECQRIAEVRYALQEAVRRRIPDLRPDTITAKLTNKLKKWWTLDFTAFRKEIKKTFKTEIKLHDRNDWETYLTTEANKINTLSNQLTHLETELNAKVYTLFKLTDAEIRIVEGE